MESEDVRALVGRAGELAELDRALDRVAAAEPWVVQIVGEPGIGKSRLLGELCRRGETRGHLVLDGRAAEFESDIPFGLIVDALNDFVGSLAPATLRALDEDVLCELASIFPSLPRSADATRPPGEGTERYRLHYAIRNLLERLTTRQPMLLALDDVHWADAASIEVMTHLLRRFRGPLLMAVAYRHAPARLVAALEGTARDGVGSRIELVPLSRKQARRLIGPDMDEGALATLYRESGGNPFYIEQLARSSHPRQIREPPEPVAAAGSRPACCDRGDRGGADNGLGSGARAASGGGRRGRSVRTRVDRRDRRDRHASGAGCAGCAARARFHPPDGRPPAVSISPPDRPQGRVRRRAARLANRSAHPRVDGAGSRPRSGQHPRAPRRDRGDPRR